MSRMDERGDGALTRPSIRQNKANGVEDVCSPPIAFFFVAFAV